MDNASTLDVVTNPTEEKTDFRAAIRQMFTRMEEADARIARDQADIDRLKAETRAILATLPRPGDRLE